MEDFKYAFGFINFKPQNHLVLDKHGDRFSFAVRLGYM